MPSVWEILDLPVGQRDQRAIKRAYARLLKQHRPDQDPEGFLRVHAAYQTALQWAGAEEKGVGPSHDPLPVIEVSRASEPLVSGPASPVSQPEPFSATSVHSGRMISPWEVTLDVVQAAADQPAGVLRDGALADALRRVAELAPLIPDGGAMLIRLLEKHVTGGYATWRSIFTDDHLLAEVRSGGNDLTLGTLRGCFEASDWDRLIRFATRWLNDARVSDHDQRDTFALNRVLVIWLALVDYPLAQRLLQQFPAHVLRVTDEELDQVMTMGHQARGLPDTARRYLCDLLRGKGGRDAESVVARGHLLAHLPGIPTTSLLGQVMHRHFPGYQAHRRTADGQTVVPVNLLSVSITACAITLFIGLIAGMMALSPTDVWAGIISLVALVGIIFGGIGVYHRTAPWYFRTLRPWLWMKLGPFDVPCRVLILWLAIGIVVPLLANTDASGVLWLVVALLFLPVGLLVIRWGRLLVGALLADLPTWRGTGERLRYALMGGGTIGGDLNMDGSLRALRSIGSGLPAMLLAGVLVVGLATCPAWVPESRMYVVAFNAWTAPWAIAALIIHARLLHWRQQNGSWRVPFLILVWCVWLPAAAWLATMSLVWTGHAQEPAGIRTGVLAVVVAALLPMTVAWRLRRR